MKWFCIFFSTSVSLVGLLVLDSIEAQVKRYANFDDFLAELKTTADSWLDYVTKMQALLCPNQPICGAEGYLERKDVLETLPAVLTVGSRTVNLEDIPSFVGVCCLPCSCFDSCRQNDNCCPTKQMFPDNSNKTNAIREECIAATVSSYRNKIDLASYHRDHTHYMITDCFHDNTNLTLVAKCQNPGRTTEILSHMSPVTSQTTGFTYWNMHCAVCNDDADDVMEWSASVIIKKIIPFFSNSSLNGAFPDTFEKLFPFLNSARYSDIIYTPPVAVEDSSCLIRDLLRLKHCEQSTEEALSTFDRLFDSCRQFYNPVRSSSQNFYKNIFCFVCLNTLQLTSNNPSCSQREAVRAQSGYLTALFNYKSESAKPESHEEDLLVADGPCGCAEIFDPYLKLCRTSYCPAGVTRAACQCIQLLKNLTGMPVVIMVKVMAISDTTSPLTGTQFRKLHIVLQRALEAIAKHTTAEMVTTFQQENTTSQLYLFVVIITPDPDLDTKLTMKPFLRYLDTDDKLELNAGKLHFSATLTTKAMIWTAWPKPSEPGFFL